MLEMELIINLAHVVMLPWKLQNYETMGAEHTHILGGWGNPTS